MSQTNCTITVKPDIQAILNSFNITGDLCPIRSPKYYTQK